VDLPDLADQPGLDPLVGQPRALGGVALVAHLRHHAGGAGGLRDRAVFGERVRKRFLAIDVLAGAERGGRGDGVDVVGRAHSHRVDPPCLAVEHTAEVLVARRLGKGRVGAGGALVVDVAQSHDLGAVSGVRGDVAAAHAPRADPRDPHPFAGR